MIHACAPRLSCRYQNIELAVDEVNRCAADPRFVQVLLLALGEQPLGKSHFWPIYRAAEKHGLTLGIHAGSTYHHAVTGSGWPSYYLEDYAAQSLGFHAQVGSLIAEGVFVKFPKLKAVLIESGVTWLAAYLWRFSKFWRGVRLEVPWIDRPPMEIVRDHIRLTIQPFDAPHDADVVQRILDQLPSRGDAAVRLGFPSLAVRWRCYAPGGHRCVAQRRRSWSTTRLPPIRVSALRPARRRHAA